MAMSHPRPVGNSIGASDPLAGAISHELHRAAQPLTILQGLLELALLSSSTPEEYRAVIQNAFEQSRRISDSFDQLRKLFSELKSNSRHDLPAEEEIECVHV